MIKFKNTIYNTQPIILHWHGLHSNRHKMADFLYLKRRILSNLNKLKNKPDDVTILTWNNKDEKSPVEECLDMLGVDYLVLGKGVSEWRIISLN